MERVPSQSSTANQAIAMLEQLQSRFVKKLGDVCTSLDKDGKFERVEWFRDEGQHGGGVRYVAPSKSLFNRGSVNISQVQYDDQAEKKLASANALSTIIHPGNPHSPSVHMHISWTEMKDGKGYWRVMADLNPSINNDSYKNQFDKALEDASKSLYKKGKEQGEKYFYIPALKRHRGVSHFYLEAYHSDDPKNDFHFAQSFGEAMIDCYVDILSQASLNRKEVSESDLQAQLDYHSLYFYQVLTLDRGTSSGLLVHKQNDVGTLGSLPSHVNRKLLQDWQKLTQEPQNKLLASLVATLPEESPSPVENETKAALAEAIRVHYQQHPEALAMQARGDIIPPTVANHKD